MSEPEPRATDLTKEERVLVRVRDLLYEGSWDELVKDLQGRLGRKPYVFQLATKIEEDLARIAKLRAMEGAGADLREAVEAAEALGAEPRRKKDEEPRPGRARS